MSMESKNLVNEPFIHQALAIQALHADPPYVDQRVTSAQILVDSQRAYDIDLAGLVAINQHWQTQGD